MHGKALSGNPVKFAPLVPVKFAPLPVNVVKFAPLIAIVSSLHSQSHLFLAPDPLNVVAVTIPDKSTPVSAKSDCSQSTSILYFINSNF